MPTPRMADGWSHLVQIREVKEQRTLWPKVRLHLLDQEYWYPNMFKWILALFPLKFLERSASWISLSVHLITAIICGVYASPIVGIVYFLTPTCLSEFRNLNARAWSCLLVVLTLTIQPPWNFIPAFATLLSHKMAVQFLVWPAWYVLLPAAVLALPLGYWKILRAHLDILRFWTWAFRQPKPDEPHILLNPSFNEAWSGQIKRHLFHGAPIFLGLAGFWHTPEHPFVAWILIVITLAIATTVPLRIFGEGWKYYKYAALPAAVGICNLGPLPTTLYTLAGLTFLVAILADSLASPFLASENPTLTRIMAQIKPHHRVACLPLSLCDMLAYKCRCQVLWGGHGYGFDNLKGFYPYLTLDELKRRLVEHSIDFLILDKNFVEAYATPVMADRVTNPLTTFGALKYCIVSTSIDSTYITFSKEALNV